MGSRNHALRRKDPLGEAHGEEEAINPTAGTIVAENVGTAIRGAVIGILLSLLIWVLMAFTLWAL